MARKTKMRLSAIADKPPAGARSSGGRSPTGGRPPHGRGPRPPGSDPFASEDDRLETAGFVAGSIIVAVIVIGLAVVFGGRGIEAGLQEDVDLFLRRNELRDLQVTASGLDVEVIGVVNSDTTAAALPNAIRGQFPWIRTLDVQVRVVLPREAIDVEIEADPLVFAWSGDAVTVTGTMSNQSTVDAIVSSLASTFGTVDAGGLVVLEGVANETDWLTTMLQLVREVAPDVGEGQVTVNSEANVVQFAAEFKTRQERADVRAAAEEVLSASTFDFSSGLTVEDIPTTTVPQVTIEEVQRRFEDTLTGKTVEFEFSSAALTAEGRALLDEVLVTLLEFPAVPIRIEGHTDSVGSAESNLELSRQRAESVVAYLVAGGAEAARFEVVGLGEAEPIADNDTEEGRAQNRRIVFIALED